MDGSPRALMLSDYVRIVRSNLLLIVGMAALFAAAAYLYSDRAEDEYRAEASLLFREPRQDVDTIGVATAVRQSPEQRAAIGAQTVTRPEVTEAVKAQLNRKDLGVAISARVETRSMLVVIQGVSSDPRAAARVANAYARQTVRISQREFEKEIDRLIRTARKQFRSFDDSREPLIRAENARLLARLRSLRAVGQPVQVTRRASPPAAPFAPKPRRNALLALVLGLTLGLIAAFARAAADRRLRRTDDIERVSGLPILGQLTDRQRYALPGRRRRREALRLEAARVLRTNVEHLDPDRPLRTILVTSSLPDEGKTTVSRALATASALAGRRTLLVEGDLRRPELAKELGIEHRPGLSELLAGDAELDKVGQQVAAGHGASYTTIVAGAAARHPADLLASDALSPVLAELAAHYDTVVIDSSPLLPVGDTLEVVPHVDAVLVCVRSGRTSEDELTASRETLARLPKRPSGIVLTGRTGRGSAPGAYAGKRAYGRLPEASKPDKKAKASA
jgi:capsular exopolysaccharide synthesis family protein